MGATPDPAAAVGAGVKNSGPFLSRDPHHGSVFVHGSTDSAIIGGGLCVSSMGMSRFDGDEILLGDLPPMKKCSAGKVAGWASSPAPSSSVASSHSAAASSLKLEGTSSKVWAVKGDSSRVVSLHSASRQRKGWYSSIES